MGEASEKHIKNTGTGLARSWEGVTDYWNVPKNLSDMGRKLSTTLGDGMADVADYVNSPSTENLDITAGVDYSGSAGTRDINSINSNAYYAMLTGKNPQLSQQVQSRAEQQAMMAFSPFGQAMDTYAQQQSNQQRRAVEQRLSGSGILGTGSGAANAAISQAIARPYAEADVAMQKEYGNLYQNAYDKQLSELSSMSQQAIVAPQTMSQMTSKGQTMDFLANLFSALV
jgi:hypothetical protein